MIYHCLTASTVYLVNTNSAAQSGGGGGGKRSSRVRGALDYRVHRVWGEELWTTDKEGAYEVKTMETRGKAA